jgi:hypothetical protein
MSEETAIPADQPDVSLSATSRAQLVKALRAAFGLRDLELLTRYKLNEKLEEVAEEGNLRETTFGLVEWAHAHGRMRDLVTGALAENSGNPQLRDFYEGVWARALAGDPSVLEERGGVSQPGPVPPPPRWYESPLVRWGLVVVVIIGIAAIVLRPIVASFIPGIWLSVRSGTMPIVAFDLTANNYHGPIVVEGRLVDSETLQPIPTTSTPQPQTFELDPDSRHAEWSWQKLTFSPSSTLPTPHCVAVQVVAYDGDGYPDNKVELAKATSRPGFYLGPSSERRVC